MTNSVDPTKFWLDSRDRVIQPVDDGNSLHEAVRLAWAEIDPKRLPCYVTIEPELLQKPVLERLIDYADAKIKLYRGR